MTERIAIYIATPVHYSVEAEYCTSMLKLVAEVIDAGVSFKLDMPVGESLITRSRNKLVARFLKTDYTHLLFIDSDIQFEPDGVKALVESGHKLVGGIYPKKGINWDSVREGAKAGADNLAEYMGDFVVNCEGGEVTCTNECVPVIGLGTGFLLIARDVVEKMIAAHPETAYTSDSADDYGDTHHALFDCGIVDGRYLSEDYLFCRRAIALGIQPMAHLGVKLGHVGRQQFKGDLSKAFQPKVP